MTNGDHSDERDPLLVRPFVLRDQDSDGHDSDGQDSDGQDSDGQDSDGQDSDGQGSDGRSPGERGSGNLGSGDLGRGSGSLGSGTLGRRSGKAGKAAQTSPSTATPRKPIVVSSGGRDAPTAILQLPSARKDRHRRRLVVLAGGATAIVLGAAAAGFAALRDDVRPMVSTGLPGDPVPAATGPLPTGASSAASRQTTPLSGSEEGDADGDGDSTEDSNQNPGDATTPTKRATSPSVKPTGTTPSGEAGQPIALTPTPGRTTAAPPAPPSERVGLIRGQNSLCLDLSGGLAFDYNQIQVARCNDSGAQTFTLATDGTLRVLGKCATAFGDRAVLIMRCDDREAAQWRRDGQRLINASSGDCLTDPSGGRRSGSDVRVTDCNGSATQSWSLP